METKYCSKCKTHKATSEFGKNKCMKDGLSNWCKVCKRSAESEFYYKNKNLRSNKAKEYYQKNSARIVRRTRAYARTAAGRFRDLIGGAKKRGIECSITREEHAELIKQPCRFCNGRLNETSSGLDRIDSSRGYEIDNVVPCCATCNTIKNNKSLEFLIEHLPKFLEGAKKLVAPPPLVKPLSAFEKDLAFGNCAEQYLVATAPEKFELLDGRKGDIKLKQSGDLLEVKTERRSDEATPNIFVEKISNKNKQTRGGPWAALDNNCKYIAYIFWPTKRTFVYRAKDLTDYLEQSKYKPFEVFVGGSKAVGLIVPRAHIAHLEVKLEEIA